MNVINSPVFAAVLGGGGDRGVVGQLLTLLLIGLCVLIIWWMGTYFMGKFGAPPIAGTVWNAIFVILGGIFLINFLMGLAGHPMFSW